MEQTYIPVGGRELTQLQFMHSLLRCLKDDDSLKPRLQSIGKWWRYRGLLANVARLFDDVWHTIEPVKRQKINNIWAQQELRIVNKNAPVDTSGDLITIPKSALCKMAQKLQDDACGMCFGTHQERKDCEFRRALVELSLIDLRKDEKRTGKCMGHLFNWRY